MNPMEQSHPPDEPIEHFTIQATRAGNTWYVACPEWNYRNETNEAVDIHINRIVTEIKNHNENH